MTNLIDWHKSSYSFRDGECVEVGVWTKSSRSYDTGACVEVCAQTGQYHHTPLCVSIRDTEHRRLARLDFPPLSFASLLGAIK